MSGESKSCPSCGSENIDEIRKETKTNNIESDIVAARNELIKVLDYNHAPVVKAINLLDKALIKLRE